MVVDDHDLDRLVARPDKVNPVLIVDPDTVLAGAIPSGGFFSGSRRRC
jgi:hypothetical protein